MHGQNHIKFIRIHIHSLFYELNLMQTHADKISQHKQG